MKQLHLTGKIAFALVVTTAALAGCKDKDPVQPATPVVETPAVTPPATTPAPAPAPEAGSVTPPATTTTPAPEPTPPAR
jgi:hypothetical protein